MKDNKNESVKVALRIRPLNTRERELKSPLCVSSHENILQITKEADTKQFVFDYVFNLDAGQAQIYESCAYSLVESALDGYNGTIFAYGQTGAGKTFTMVGIYKDEVLKGIIPRGFQHVITAIQTSEERRYVVCASFIEIYNEDIFDLLDHKGDVKKELKESPQKGVFIKDLKTIPVKSVDQLIKILDFGNENRSVATTAMNATSSRSHALLTVHIESLEGEKKVKASKLNFVDLAGSERQGKTQASGQTLKEGAKINLSLTALGNVINALVDGRTGHIPYRDSKLTRLLQDSLGGNTKTLMIASTSPAADNYDETMSTLRYAARARNIKNTPKVNEDPKDAMIREYMAQIDKLKQQLGSGGPMTTIGLSEQEQEREIERKANEKVNEKLGEKEAELMEMRRKLQEMEGLVLKKEKETPEIAEKTKKRRLEKKKALMNEEINKSKLQKIQDEERKELEDKDAEDKDLSFWKEHALRLKKRLKALKSDRADAQKEFEDERERLRNSQKSIQADLSFYKQIAETFLSKDDLLVLLQKSRFDEEKNEYREKMTLPKTLQKSQVEDLWSEKRRGSKMEFVELPDIESRNLSEMPESKSMMYNTGSHFSKTTSNPFLSNRRAFKPFDANDERYKAKEYDPNTQTPHVIYSPNRNIRIRSNSKERSGSRSTSRNTKLAALQCKPEIKSTSPAPADRPLSKGKVLLTPVIHKQP